MWRVEKITHVSLPPQDRYSCFDKVSRQDMVKVLLSYRDLSKISASRLSLVLVQMQITRPVSPKLVRCLPEVMDSLAG